MSVTCMVDVLDWFFLWKFITQLPVTLSAVIATTSRNIVVQFNVGIMLSESEWSWLCIPICLNSCTKRFMSFCSCHSNVDIQSSVRIRRIFLVVVVFKVWQCANIWSMASNVKYWSPPVGFLDKWWYVRPCNFTAWSYKILHVTLQHDATLLSVYYMLLPLSITSDKIKVLHELIIKYYYASNHNPPSLHYSSSLSSSSSLSFSSSSSLSSSPHSHYHPCHAPYRRPR